MALSKNRVKVFLQCTVNVAALDLTVPTLLAATHLYSPLSVLFTVIIHSSLLSADKLILSLSAVTADPSLVQENVGSGMPFASLEKVVRTPSLNINVGGLLGCVVNAGCSIRSNVIF